MTPENLVRGLLKPINPYATALLGVLTLTWGLWILCPYWDVFTTAKIYAKALDFAPEWAWGTWSTMCGLGILASLWRGSTCWLARSVGFAIWHWFTVSTMLWWGDWQNTAGLTYTFIGIYTVLVFLNIKVNYVKQGIMKF